MPLLLLLLLPLLAQQPDTASAARGDQEQEILSEWVNSIRTMQPGVTLFDLSIGDSLDLDCRSMGHMAKIKESLELEWFLLNRPLTDEGARGRIHLLEDNGRLTVENANERDSGLYATYTSPRSLAYLLDLVATSERNASSPADEEASPVRGSRIAVCLFVVRVDKQRIFAVREREELYVNTAAWLSPLADTFQALGMPHEEWIITWYRDGEEMNSCRKIATCEFNVTASRELHAGLWRLELRSLVDKRDERRMLFEFQVMVRPPVTYLQAFPQANHKFYMVYGTLIIALFLLSLHLFNNLNWTPFAFDILPDQVSPKAVLDQAGVFLKESRA